MRRQWRGWLLLVVLVLAAAGGIVALRLRDRPAPLAATGPSVTQARIPAGGGVQLDATVYRPGRSGRPLVVMPASWGMGTEEYQAVALHLATRGFVVVAYAQRGFGGSGGSADFAAAPTQADASTVIDWALAHTAADPHHVGMLGVSYGGGVSLLAAAHDHRVRAVVALSTWTDLAASLDPGRTPSTGALDALFGGATGDRLSPDLAALRASAAGASTAQSTALSTQIRSLSPARSPDTVLAALNAGKPAIMIANGYEDSIFPAGQLVPFIEQLAGPRRLDLAPGDHGGPEQGGLQGRTNAVINAATAWLDRYLGDTNSLPGARDPIQLTDVRTGAVHGYRRWPVRATSNRLGVPGSAREFGPRIARSWTADLQEGTASAADSGPISFLDSSQYVPPTIQMSALTRSSALVWTAPQNPAPVLVCGTPTLRVSIGSSGPAATIFSYLYDVAPDGTAALMSTAPYTATGLQAGEQQPATISMQPTCWTVPTGDHLALVVDAADARYPTADPGATVAVGSSRRHPASFSAPSS